MRNHLEMVMIRGFVHFEFRHFMSKVLFPVARPLLDLALIPGFAGRLIGMHVQCYYLRTLLSRFSLHLYVLLRTIIFVVHSLIKQSIALHNEIRDSRYLVGTRLTNREQEARLGP